MCWICHTHASEVQEERRKISSLLLMGNLNQRMDVTAFQVLEKVDRSYQTFGAFKPNSLKRVGWGDACCRLWILSSK